MTREEFRIALDMSLTKDRAGICLEYINYLESRTCSSCKYANIIPNEPKWIECSNIAQYFTLDYGCNKWEAKDER